MKSQRQSRTGFTIIEMLVVVAILGVLLGLLAPALTGVKRRALKSQEQTGIRQVFVAWDLYATNNDDKLLPGHLDEAVQENWGLRTKLPNNTVAEYDVAQGYPLRLLSYLDDNYAILRQYAEDGDAGLLDNERSVENYAFAPAFGYNAHYLGGWWVADDPVEQPNFRFYAPALDNNNDGQIFDTERGTVVALSMSQIRRPADVIAFGSSTRRNPGVAKFKKTDVAVLPHDPNYPRQEGNYNFPGSPYIFPPVLAQELVWQIKGPGGSLLGMLSPFTTTDLPTFLAQTGGSEQGGLDTIEVYSTSFDPRPSVPFSRYNQQVSIVTCDGSVSGQTMSALNDMQKWVDAANKRDFTHTTGPEP